MSRWLIVNVDEFGLTEGINEGIIQAHKYGIVTDTTMLPNMWAFDDAVELAREHDDLAVGVHLNITYGGPILPPERVPSLVNEQGQFYRRAPFLRRLLLGKIDLSEVAAEFRAQVDKVIKAGINPSHLDSHESIYMHPSIFRVLLPLARELALPVRLQDEAMPQEAFSSTWLYKRYVMSEAYFKHQVINGLARRYREWLHNWQIPTSDYFLSTFNSMRRNPNLAEALAYDLRNTRSGVTELMAHCGFSDDRLEVFLDGGRKAALWREDEIRVLTSGHLKQLIADEGIQPISYRSLSAALA